LPFEPGPELGSVSCRHSHFSPIMAIVSMVRFSYATALLPSVVGA
jgi:hypothetical protein